MEPLKRLLDSLAAQEYRDFSLLLGDQNPEGFLDGLLERYAGIVPLQLVRFMPCGLSEARNRLLPLARGDYFALADDDCHYAPDAFAQVRRYMRETSFAGALVGAGSAMPGPVAPGWKPPQPMSRFAVFYRAPSWCLFVRKEGADAIGGFDENLGIGSPTPWQSGEETDYLLRLLEAGYPVFRAPGVRIFHDDEAAAGNPGKTRAYGMGRMRLLAKHDFPPWFRLAHVAYPLLRLPLDIPSGGPGAVKRRMAMFKGRWEGFWKA